MRPRIALGTAGAFILSAIVIVPTAAKAKPVTGTVSCTLSGSAMISPGLVLSADCSGGATCPTGFQCTTSGGTSTCTATKKLTTTTTFVGTLSNCTGSQTNTPKGAPISAGTVSAKAKTKLAVGQPVSSCLALQSPTTPTSLTTTVKFTTTGGKTVTSKGTLTVGDASLIPVVSFPVSGPVTGGTAFKGDTLTATAVLDDSAAELAALCNGGTSTTFEFTGIQGDSTLDVAP